MTSDNTVTSAARTPVCPGCRSTPRSAVESYNTTVGGTEDGGGQGGVKGLPGLKGGGWQGVGADLDEH